MNRDKFGGILVGMALMAMVVPIMLHNYWMPRSEHAQVRSEYRDSVATLTDSINRLKSRSDTITVIIEAASKYDISPDMAERIIRAAKQEGVDPKIGLELVYEESSFRSNAVSHVGAVGLTQIKPSTARIFDPGITVGDLYDKDTNLRLGFRYLYSLLERYGNYREALASYNVGPTHYDAGVNRQTGKEYAQDVISR